MIINDHKLGEVGKIEKDFEMEKKNLSIYLSCWLFCGMVDRSEEEDFWEEVEIVNQTKKEEFHQI